MTTRRGSITKRRGKWVLRWYHGVDQATSRKVYSQESFTLKADAEAKRAVLVGDRDSMREGVRPYDNTLSAWLTDWIASKRSLATRTRADLEYLRDHYIPDDMRATRLAALSPERIDRWVGEMTERGLAPRTIGKALSELRWALRAAVKRRLLKWNPAQDVEAPAPVQVKRRWLQTGEELARFLVAARAERNGCFFELMVLCGARPGELLAAKWDDIKAIGERRFLMIDKAMTGGRTGRREVGPTKTRRARQLTLGADEWAALEAHRVRQARERLQCGPAWQDLGLVFTTEIGTPLSMQNLSKRTFRPILTAAKLPPMRPYDLRHTHLSLLAAAGVDPKLIQERAGHARIQTTYDFYVHTADDAQDKAVDVMQALTAAGRKAIESPAAAPTTAPAPFSLVERAETRRRRAKAVESGEAATPIRQVSR
jgi:integrase